METLADFHFLRPTWFLLVPLTLLVVWLVRLRGNSVSAWEAAIDPALLPYLLRRPEHKPGRSPTFLLLLAWLAAIFALAGPVWQKPRTTTSPSAVGRVTGSTGRSD